MAHSPEFIEQVRQLWSAGYSGSEIGARLGTTKNVIIGIAHRRGFGTHEVRVTKSATPRRVRNRKANSSVGRLEGPTIRDGQRLAPIPQQRQIVNIAGITTGCRYLHGDPLDFNWCGEPIEAGSYCARHYKACHMRRPVKDQAAETIHHWPAGAA